MRRVAEGGEARVLVVGTTAGVVETLSALVRRAGGDVVVADPADGLQGASPSSWAGAALVLAEWSQALALGPRPAGALVLVCPAEPEPEVWRDAVLLGAEHVVVLPDGQGWLVARVERAVRGRAPAPLVAVVGGRGGAGASVLATALALTAARRDLEVTLLDLDPLGGGLDLLLGAEHAPGLRWGDLRHVTGHLPAGLLGATAVRAEGIALVTWERDRPAAVAPGTVQAVLERAADESDLVVADLPRGVDDVTRTVLRAARQVLVVVPAEVRAAAAAARVAAEIDLHAADVALVVRGPAPTGLAAEAVCEAVGLPLAGEVRAEPGLAAALDRGDVPALRPRGPLAALAARLVVAALASPAPVPTSVPR